MTDSEKELVAYIRAQTEWCSRRLSGGDWFAIDPDTAPFRAADAIERLVKERDEARAKSVDYLTMLGIGDGTGKLFVYGDYDSIKAAQAYIFRAEAAGAEVARLREALAPFVTLTKTDGPVWYYESADDSVVVRCELTVGEIRQARSALERNP